MCEFLMHLRVAEVRAGLLFDDVTCTCTILPCRIFARALVNLSNMRHKRVRIHALVGYHFSPFAVGQIKAHMHHGWGATQIARVVTKPDGKSHWSHTAVQIQMDALANDPTYTGIRQPGSGPKRKTTKKQDRQVLSCVIRNRGRKKVTVNWLKTQFTWARRLSNTLIEERLFEAGLAYMRRRKKHLVTKAYLQPRIAYSTDVLTKRQTTLDKWGYSDGTVWYLDRDADEHENSLHAALGTMVWKRADRTDSLYRDCIGPSSYCKGQGNPVKVWGVLAEGKLFIHVLESGEHMNQYLYAELIAEKFEKWYAARKICKTCVQGTVNPHIFVIM